MGSSQVRGPKPRGAASAEEAEEAEAKETASACRRRRRPMPPQKKLARWINTAFLLRLSSMCEATEHEADVPERTRRLIEPQGERHTERCARRERERERGRERGKKRGKKETLRGRL
jgi:hypothetical protein